VAIHAQQFPIAAVGRVMVVVVVLVVHGQLLNIAVVEGAGAASADPGEEFERAVAIGFLARRAIAPRFGDDAVRRS
jgi:hypothetical protein